MTLGNLRGPIVIPQNLQPRTDFTSDYFFTPEFFYGEVNESSSIQSLIGQVAPLIKSRAAISEEEYAFFNSLYSVPANAFFGRYDFVKVSYDYVSFEVRRMLDEVLEVSIPESDISNLIIEIIRCEKKQVLKFFDTNQWVHSTDNMMTNAFGAIAATCSDRSVELFAYHSKIQASSRTSIADGHISEDDKVKAKLILHKWLALHFAEEFTN